MAVKPDWIDYNGHLNMAYYNVLFDRGVDQVWEYLGLGPKYAEARNMTTFTADFRVRYLRELHVGAEVTATWQLLDHDAKRLHFYQELLHSDGWCAATGEGVTLHIDRSGPRVCPFPGDILERISELAASHSALSKPQATLRPLGLG